MLWIQIVKNDEAQEIKALLRTNVCHQSILVIYTLEIHVLGISKLSGVLKTLKIDEAAKLKWQPVMKMEVNVTDMWYQQNWISEIASTNFFDSLLNAQDNEMYWYILFLSNQYGVVRLDDILCRIFIQLTENYRLTNHEQRPILMKCISF